MDIGNEVYTRVAFGRQLLWIEIWHEYLLLTVHEIIGAECNTFAYEIKFLLNTAGKITRFMIKNDRDVQFSLGGSVRILKVYVIVQPCQQACQLSRPDPKAEHVTNATCPWVGLNFLDHLP